MPLDRVLGQSLGVLVDQQMAGGDVRVCASEIVRPSLAHIVEAQ